MDNRYLDKIILASLEEDASGGDITTEATIPADKTASGKFIAKESGIVCGLDVAKRVFSLVDDTVVFTPLVKEGVLVNKGDIIATVEGNARALLTGERTALNLMQRMSGIATRTKEAVDAVRGTNAKITDTRKTTPLLRRLEKYAVRVGGGTNHRFNLSDGLLIKDNHIAAAGSITEAVKSAKAYAPHTLKIEVEVETFSQLDEALNAGADIIMLDNMNIADMKKAVEIVNKRAVLEASGNMGERDLSEVAKTGVDLISIGALTHSPRAMDISLKFKLK